MVSSVAQAYFKTAFNNRSIVEGEHFKFHTADYVKNKIPPIMVSEVQTIINSLEHHPPPEK